MEIFLSTEEAKQLNGLSEQERKEVLSSLRKSEHRRAERANRPRTD